MLSWWLGKGAVGASRGLDESSDLEPPETPAPVFAARALKSAIFGTPAPSPGDETLYEIEQEAASTIPDQDTPTPLAQIVIPRRDRQLQPENMSPTKGILLTPGTATAKKKTVSFGNGVEDKTATGRVVWVGSHAEDTSIKKSDDWLKRGSTSKCSRKTSLRETLENARDEKASSSMSNKTENREPFGDIDAASKAEKTNSELLQEFIWADGAEREMTVDLNEPQSQSGKYWKAQYYTYNEEARAEMELLLRYKYLARSYAKKRDSEAIDLAAKLREEQQKVLGKEEKISRLSAKIARLGARGGTDENTPEMIKELARQTALAVHYKSEVEAFRVALEEGKPNSSNKHSKNSPLRSEDAPTDTNRELRKAREQLREMSSLREELNNVRQALSTVEKANKKLQDDNARLTQDLIHADLRLEKHQEKNEKRKQSYDEQNKIRETAQENLQNDYNSLKEKAKSQRHDAEHLLNKRHEQVVALKKEIASLKIAESTVEELQKTIVQNTAEHERTVVDLQTQLAEFRSGSRKAQRGHQQQVSEILPMKENRRPEASAMLAVPIEPSPFRESLIPVSIRRGSKASPHSEMPPRSRSSQRPLSEIVNTAGFDTVPPEGSGPVQYTPFVRRYSDMNLESPGMDLPPLEPSLALNSGRKIFERSPRPSIFNIPSSPPKLIATRSRSSPEGKQQRSGSDVRERRPVSNNSTRVGSSVETSRKRSTMPPERAAAAKARLEQKKIAAQAHGAQKENCHS